MPMPSFHRFVDPGLTSMRGCDPRMSPHFPPPPPAPPTTHSPVFRGAKLRHEPKPHCIKALVLFCSFLSFTPSFIPVDYSFRVTYCLFFLVGTRVSLLVFVPHWASRAFWSPFPPFSNSIQVFCRPPGWPMLFGHKRLSPTLGLPHLCSTLVFYYWLAIPRYGGSILTLPPFCFLNFRRPMLYWSGHSRSWSGVQARIFSTRSASGSTNFVFPFPGTLVFTAFPHVGPVALCGFHTPPPHWFVLS